MARNTTPNKGSNQPGSAGRGRKIGNKEVRAASGNRGLIYALAGFTAVAIIVIALLAILSTTGNQSATDNFTPNNQGLIKTGQTAPNFTAKNLNGSGNVSLSGDQKATMLVFFASWCPHCNREAPIISDLQHKYQDQGLKVIMVGVDGADNPQKVQQFVNKYNISGPAVYQPQLVQPYKVSGYPTVYVLDNKDRVVGSNVGETPASVYEGWIQKALG